MNGNAAAAAAARSSRRQGAASYDSDVRVGRGQRPVITRTMQPNAPVVRSNEARVFTPNQPRFNGVEGTRRGGNRNGLGRNRGGGFGGRRGDFDGSGTAVYQGNAGNESTQFEGRRGGRHQRFHDRHEGDPNFRQTHRRWHRQRQDRSWWTSRYNRFALFGGGYYYFNSGYWYPAYGYDPSYSTYTYDAPLYGYNGLEPGQVIASVQAELQRLGYNPGGVDGSFGPRTRRALIDFQQDNGLPVTGEIDEETLNALGLE
ncbi:MAG: peptidoglycan-binding domain-containing protein [Chthoniobacterales bacterium]